MQRPERSLSLWLLATATIVSIPLIIAFCLTYVSIEDPVYIWDNRGYWSLFQNYGLLIYSGTEDWQQPVLNAIRNSDYNPSAVIPLYPFYRWFGGGRESYLIAVSLLYLLPTVVIATSIGLCTARVGGVAAAALAFLAAITYMPFWAPTLRGMVDIVGLVFLGIATLIMLRSDFLSRKPFLNSLILGVILWAPFLLRRWYAYSIVAFFLASYIFGIFTRWHQNERRWRELFVFTICLGVAGAIVLVCILQFQWGLAERAVTTSYSDLYEAYQIPFIEHFRNALSQFGWYILIIIALGMLSAILRPNIETLFCLSCAVLTFFLFTHTQAMGPHHFLPVAFWLFPVYFAGLIASARRLTFLPNSLRILPFASASIIIFAFGVSPALERSGVLGNFFIPRQAYHPLHLENLPEYRRMISDLQSDLEKDDRFVVWASSPILSDELLVTLEPALASHYIAAPHIANQDLFRFEMLGAEYAVAVTPPQTHQAPGSQRNITIPGEMLLERVGFGSAFEKVGVYALANGATGFLFRRQRSVTSAETTDVMERLVEAYPDWRRKFQEIMVLPFAAREVVVGDVLGRAEVQDNTTMFLHPGATQPTLVSLPLPQEVDTRPSSIRFTMDEKLVKQCPGADGTVITVTIDGNRVWSGDLVPGGALSAPIPSSGRIVSINVDKKLQPNCDHVLARFEF